MNWRFEDKGENRGGTTRGRREVARLSWLPPQRRSCSCRPGQVPGLAGLALLLLHLHSFLLLLLLLLPFTINQAAVQWWTYRQSPWATQECLENPAKWTSLPQVRETPEVEPSTRGPPLQYRLSPLCPLIRFLLHSLVECTERLRAFFIYFFFSVFAFVNRNRGNLFSSTVQGPAPLTQDEPLAEMHLHALCRYSLVVIQFVTISCFCGCCLFCSYALSANWISWKMCFKIVVMHWRSSSWGGLGQLLLADQFSDSFIASRPLDIVHVTVMYVCYNYFWLLSLSALLLWMYKLLVFGSPWRL